MRAGTARPDDGVAAKGVPLKAMTDRHTSVASGWTLALRQVSAERDVALFDAVADSSRPRSERLDAILTAGFLFDDNGDMQPRRLGMIDRQAALFRLALTFGRWPAWFVAICDSCGAFADIRADVADFSYEPAAIGYPYFSVTAADGCAYAFVAPNGTHEALIERAAAPVPTLIAATCLDAAGPPVDDAEFVAKYAAAVDAVSPTFLTKQPFDCPTCGTGNIFWFDPLDWIARFAATTLRDIDRLASAYGWSESAILAMSPARRRAYLALREGAK
jgi:hypothetical protein